MSARKGPVARGAADLRIRIRQLTIDAQALEGTSRGQFAEDLKASLSSGQPRDEVVRKPSTAVERAASQIWAALGGQERRSR